MSMADRILVKEAARRRIGWVDFSSDSWDRRVARARANRIIMRTKGVRMTLNQAIQE